MIGNGRRYWVVLVLSACILMLFPYGLSATLDDSPHNFADDADISDGSSCGGCHLPHNAAGDYTLWKRDLGSEENLNSSVDGSPSSEVDYQHTPTVPCYDCHSGTNLDNDPRPIDFSAPHNEPQNTAFGEDGIIPGGDPGYYENNPPGDQSYGIRSPLPVAPDDRIGGHYFKYFDPTNSSNDKFDQGDKLPCRDCHDPHVSVNEAFIRTNLASSSPALTNLHASTNMTYSTGFSRDDAASRDICITCHGIWNDTFTGMQDPEKRISDISPEYSENNLIVRPPTGVSEHAYSSTTACTDCHNHNYVSAACSRCHGDDSTQIWPDGVDNNTQRVDYADDQAGAHEKHLQAIGQHLGYGSDVSTYSQGQQVSICQFCHPSPGSGGHDTNTGGTQPVTGENLTNRVDVYQDTDDDGTPPYTDVFKKYVLNGTPGDGDDFGDDVNGVSRSSTDLDQAYNYAAENCSNLVCHNQVPTPPAPDGWSNPPDWSGAGESTDPTCSTTTCHDPGTYTVCHDMHALPGNKGYDCKECHMDYSHTSPAGVNRMHQNGMVNMEFDTPGSMEFMRGGGDGFYDKYDTANNTHDVPQDEEWPYQIDPAQRIGADCLNLYCHGGDMAMGGANTSPSWPSQDGSPLPTYQCGDCHDTDTSDTTPASFISMGSHTTHIDDTILPGPAYGPKAACTDCHPVTMDATPPPDHRNTDTAHADGMVSFTDGSGVAMDGISSDTSVTVCDTCHGNDALGTNGTDDGGTGDDDIESRLAKNYWSQAAGSWITEPQTVDAVLGGGTGDTRVAGGSTYCLNCHDATPSTIGIPAPEKDGFWDSAGHGLAPTSTYAPSGRTGAGAACTGCHDELSAHISGAAGDDRLDTSGNGLCAGCHDGTADGPGGKSEAQVSTHANTSTTMGYAAQEDGLELNCFECHDVHGTANIFMINSENPDGGLTDPRTIDGGTDTTNFLFFRFLAPGSVAFSANAAGSDYATALAGDPNKICQTCHTNTGYYQNTSDSGHYTDRCTGCHPHDLDGNFAANSQDGFMPQGCNGCHTYPGLTTQANTHRLSTSHDGHVGRPSDESAVENKGYGCGQCHDGADHNTANLSDPLQWDTVVNADIHVQVRFDDFNPTARDNNGPLSTDDSTSFDDANNVCNNLYCHGAEFSVPSGTNNTPDWDDVNTGECGTCHGSYGSPYNSSGTARTVLATGNHQVHYQQYDSLGAAIEGFGPQLDPHPGNARGGCNVCHNIWETCTNACHVSGSGSSLPTPTHVDQPPPGRVDFRIDTLPYPDSTDPWGYTPLTLAATPACDNCHTTYTSVNIPTSGTTLAKNNWSDDAFKLECITCHNGLAPGTQATADAGGTGNRAPAIEDTYFTSGHGLYGFPAPLQCMWCHGSLLGHIGTSKPASNPWRIQVTNPFDNLGEMDRYCTTDICHGSVPPNDHTWRVEGTSPPPETKETTDTHPTTVEAVGAGKDRWFIVPADVNIPLFGNLIDEGYDRTIGTQNYVYCVSCHDPHGVVTAPLDSSVRNFSGQNNDPNGNKMLRFDYSVGTPTPLCTKCHT